MFPEIWMQVHPLAVALRPQVNKHKVRENN